MKVICKSASIIFTLIFFGLTLWLSLNPAKIVDNVGKILSPALSSFYWLAGDGYCEANGCNGVPQDDYTSGAFMKGFTEGYNTMDALASLVFGIIVINAIRSMGVTE